MPQISDVVRAAERLKPSTPKQAGCLHVDEVRDIATCYGPDKDWMRVQTAAAMAVGFMTLMRMIEVVSLDVKGIRIVLKWDIEKPLLEFESLPRASTIKGVFIHLGWRKAAQTRDVWLPVACPTTISLLMTHLRHMKKRGELHGALFRSRPRQDEQGKSERRWSCRQAVKAVKRALQEVCGFPPVVANLFTGHCLRVGGSNFMRSLDTFDADVHRQLGGWMSLTTSTGYMQLSPAEQFALVRPQALIPRHIGAPSFPAPNDAGHAQALDAVRALAL